jgi:outer membrane cobalamin receptor
VCVLNRKILFALIGYSAQLFADIEGTSNKEHVDNSLGAAEQAIEDRQDLGDLTVEDESEEMDLIRSPMPVSVIDAERFHGRNISLNEVLKRVAGVRLAQEGGLGSRSTIAIHGLEGKRVKIFIDGKPMNTPDGTLGINDIPIQLVERIEIYKGVVPARFGGDALGGAVNVVTRDFHGSWVDATLSLGSYDTQRLTGVLTKYWEEEKVEIGIGGFYNHAANDYIMNSPYADGLKIRRDHDDYESYIYAFAGKVEDRWFDEISWELVHFESTQEIQGIQENIQAAENKSDFNFLGLSFEKQVFFVDGLQFEYDFGRPEINLHHIDKATTCYNFDGSERSCPGLGGEISGVPHDSSDEQNELRHDLNLNYSFNREHALNFHWNSLFSEYKPSDDLASEALGYEIGDFPSERTNQVYTLSFESSFLNDTVVTDIGTKRYDYDYIITSQERALSGTPQRTRNEGSESGYYLSARYSPLPDFYLKASYEEAYRLPDTTEAFGDGVSIISSPEILPEEGKNFNLGVLFDRFDVYGMPWLKLEANYFHRDITNMIKLVASHRSKQYVNLGEIEVEGYEIEVKADITDQWYVYFNFTDQELIDQQKYLIGTISTPNPTYGLDVPNVPNQYTNLGFEYKMLGLFRDDAMLKLFWETTWIDEYYYGWKLSRYQDRMIDEQISHTAGFEYSFDDDHIIIGFEARNLTDEELTDVYKYPLMGKTYNLNLRYTWFQ